MPKDVPGSQHSEKESSSRDRPGSLPQEAAAFLAALVGTGPAALSSWAARSQPDVAWADWLAGQGLASYACYRLRQSGKFAQLAPEVQRRLQAAWYSALADTELHQRELKNVLHALAEAGIRPVIFKGAALANTVYPEPACRPMGDLDLWLSAEEMALGQAALKKLGYIPHDKAARPAALQAQASGEVQMVGREPGSGLVELHWGIFAGEWLRRTAAVNQAEIRRRVVPVTVVGEPAAVLAPEDALIQLAVHLAVNHQFAYPWVRGLVDIALLARQQPVDWDTVARRARDWRVGTATWQVLRMAVSLVGLSVEASCLESLCPSPLRRSLIGLLVNDESLLARRDLTRGPLRFLLQLLLVDRPRDALRLLGRALWPEAEWLALRYGDSTTAVRWRHLAQAVRGRV